MTSKDAPEPQRPTDDSVNPFISFRRFADEQMSSLLHSLLGLPSASERSSTNSSKRFGLDDDIWLQQARVRHRYLARESEEAEKTMDLFRKAMQEEKRGADEAAEVPRCPCQPTDSEISECKDAVVPYDPMPSLAQRVLLPADLLGRDWFDFPLWSPAYLTSSPYSPLRLERIKPFCSQGDKWRHAFEDLIAFETGTSMPEEGSRPKHQREWCWMSSMMERGCLANGWKKSDLSIENENDSSIFKGFYFPAYPEEEHDSSMIRASGEHTAEDETCQQDTDDMASLTSTLRRGILGDGWKGLNQLFQDEVDSSSSYQESRPEKTELAELDLYEKFLDGQENPQPPTESSSSSSSSSSFNSVQPSLSPHADKPSLVSTLTTTERSTLPDGSTHTKVVLKKRFSDGREESSETVHTAYDKQQQPPLSQLQWKGEKPAHSDNPKDATEEKKGSNGPEGTKKGWFWS